MNPHLVLRQFAAAARVALTMGSVAAALLLMIWFRTPEKVDQLDALLQHYYFKPYRDAVSKAQTALAAGQRTAAIEHLEVARSMLAPVQSGDRLDSLKRETLQQLADLYEAESRSDLALTVYDEWATFDGRDIRPITARAFLAGPDGEATLAALRRRFPQDSFSRRPNLAQRIPDPTDALASIKFAADRISATTDLAWQVFWADSFEFQQADSQTLLASADAGGMFSIQIGTPRFFNRLRVDGPSSPLLVANLSVSIQSGGKTVDIPLWNAEYRNHMTNVSERVLRFDGPDPHVHVAVAESIPDGGPLAVRVTGQVLGGTARESS